jgi:hypothetical protein
MRSNVLMEKFPLRSVFFFLLPLIYLFLKGRAQKWACSFYEGTAMITETTKGKNSLVEQKLIRKK